MVEEKEWTDFPFKKYLWGQIRDLRGKVYWLNVNFKDIILIIESYGLDRERIWNPNDNWLQSTTKEIISLHDCS